MKPIELWEIAWDIEDELFTYLNTPTGWLRNNIRYIEDLTGDVVEPARRLISRSISRETRKY